MSNSALVSYVKLSPNCNKPRKDKIRKITIHHMAGNISIETCGDIFARVSRGASSNYGVGTDGRIAMYVEEANRAWTSGSRSNDNQAITIEVANDQNGGNWHVSDKALAATIDLCVDICQRNGIEKLNFTGDKNGNLTMHRYFENTACPGEYLAGKFPYIASEVNRRLAAAKSNPVKPESKFPYTVRITASKLNVRAGAGTSYKVNTTVSKGQVYTIVDESGNWGKLKSGAGWISLKYTERT